MSIKTLLSEYGYTCAFGVATLLALIWAASSSWFKGPALANKISGIEFVIIISLGVLFCYATYLIESDNIVSVDSSERPGKVLTNFSGIYIYIFPNRAPTTRGPNRHLEHFLGVATKEPNGKIKFRTVRTEVKMNLRREEVKDAVTQDQTWKSHTLGENLPIFVRSDESTRLHKPAVQVPIPGEIWIWLIVVLGLVNLYVLRLGGNASLIASLTGLIFVIPLFFCLFFMASPILEKTFGPQIDKLSAPPKFDILNLVSAWASFVNIDVNLNQPTGAPSLTSAPVADLKFEFRPDRRNGKIYVPLLNGTGTTPTLKGDLEKIFSQIDSSQFLPWALDQQENTVGVTFDIAEKSPLPENFLVSEFGTSSNVDQVLLALLQARFAQEEMASAATSLKKINFADHQL